MEDKKAKSNRAVISLRKEYEDISNKDFIGNKDLDRLREIARELGKNNNVVVDNSIWSIKKSRNYNKSIKLKKSKRVTSFTRDRR